MFVFLHSPVQVCLLILLAVCVLFFYPTTSSEPVGVMFSRSKLSDLWASSLPFASFQHPSLVQRLKAIKRCWQTLDLLTHFLCYSLKLFTAAKNLHDWYKRLFLNPHMQKNLNRITQKCIYMYIFWNVYLCLNVFYKYILFYELRDQNGFHWTQFLCSFSRWTTKGKITGNVRNAVKLQADTIWRYVHNL